MKIQDKVVIQAPLAEVWAFMTDAHQVALCAPGVESVTVIEEHKKYQLMAAVGFGNMKVKFDTSLEFLELNEPAFLKIKAHGKAAGSAADVFASMNLVALDDNSTEMSYEADVNILGTIAALANRMMVPVTKKMAGEFFTCVRKKLEA